MAGFPGLCFGISAFMQSSGSGGRLLHAGGDGNRLEAAEGIKGGYSTDMALANWEAIASQEKYSRAAARLRPHNSRYRFSSVKTWAKSSANPCRSCMFTSFTPASVIGKPV